jgi:hypothetical protein
MKRTIPYNHKPTVKKREIIWTFLILIFVPGLTSCSSIIFGMYGMKKIKPVDEPTIEYYSEKYDIPSMDSYEIDSSYFTFLFALDSTKYTAQIKNHYQPLQVLYFDKTGQLKSFQTNCYAGGFPNLKWDRNERMRTFPPKQGAPVYSLLSFENQLNHLRPLSQTETISAESYDYIVVVYWNRFMGRQSKRLIRFVQERSKLVTEKNVKIIYANTDNLFSLGQ